MSPATKELVNRVFVRFMAIYGHKFKSTFETTDEIALVKREWAISLQPYDEDVVMAAIELTKQNYSWPPAIAEFLQLIEKCQISFGLPAAEQAYEEACRYADQALEHDWSHAVVYHAGKQTGWFELRSLSTEQIWPRFQQQYKILCDKVLAGQVLTMPGQLCLPEPNSSELFQLISAWGKAHSLSDEEAQSGLYYLHLVARNPLREKLRQQQIKKHPQLSLPESIDDLRTWATDIT